MNDHYEYRRTPGKGPIWLAFSGVVLLLVAMAYFEAEQFKPLAWISGALLIGFLLVPRPAFGVRIDADHLILSAWRTPRTIPLDDIAHLRVSDGALERHVSIVYHTGEVEEIFSHDLPDIDTLIVVLAQRGIPVREV